jgi:hypothetical protein
MGLSQLGLPVHFTDKLSARLDDWLKHMLTKGVKMGKSKEKKTLDMRELDMTPATYVLEHLVGLRSAYLKFRVI